MRIRMEYERLPVVFLVIYLQFAAVTGELVLERSPDCLGDPIVFRCSVSSGRLDWTWSVFPGQSLLLVHQFNSPGVRNFPLGNTLWAFHTTNISSSFINVIATIMEPLNINGTTTTCNGQMLTINSVPIDLRPKFLMVTGNGSEANIYPDIEGDITRVDYQLSESSRRVVTQPISVNALENITFFHCQKNITYSINTACLLEDNNERLNYTLFSNETWEISRICGNVQVTCNNGDWSEDISCPEMTATTFIQTNEMNIPTTNKDETTTTTRKEEDNNILCPGRSSNVLPEIIGSVIGTFLLAFVLGNTVGLLCGWYARRKHSEGKSKENVSTDNKNLSKGPLYEEVDVELQQNISYETVKKVDCV